MGVVEAHEQLRVFFFEPMKSLHRIFGSISAGTPRYGLGYETAPLPGPVSMKRWERDWAQFRHGVHPNNFSGWYSASA